MQQLDEPPMETIHLYVVREEEARPNLLPIILSVLALSTLIALSVLFPYQQPEIRKAIRVPAVLLPLRSFTTSIAIIPTGIKTYPSTRGRGILTLTNGSVLTEQLPQGMIFTGKDGVEIATDAAILVPAGNATAYGMATVSAHTVIPGTKGNIAPLDINQVEGTSLYIRNLKAFTGGRDAYTVTFLTPQDKQSALDKAREALTQQTLSGLLDSPCKESVIGSQTLHVTWTCQFITYKALHLPGLKVLHVTVEGKIVVLDIVYVARPRILTTK